MASAVKGPHFFVYSSLCLYGGGSASPSPLGLGLYSSIPEPQRRVVVVRVPQMPNQT